MYVTEDTTRADPDTLRALYSTAIRAGASRVCISDTVGHATPAGAAAVVRFIGQVVEECGGGVGIDWHGHRDRDFAVVNTLAALDAGATRLHGAAIGIGERVGNTPMDTLLVNLVLMGYHRARPVGARASTARPCRRRPACRSRRTIRWSGATPSAPPPASTPRPSSRRSARTITELVDAVYSGVPASLVGREQEIDVGPMSGKSNVIFWLEKRGYAGDRRAGRPDLREAKASADRARGATEILERCVEMATGEADR